MHVSFCPRWYSLGGDIWQSSKFAETSWIAWPRRIPSLKQTTSVMRCECRKNQNYCLFCVCSLLRSFCPPEGRLPRCGLCALCQCVVFLFQLPSPPGPKFRFVFGSFLVWWQSFAEGLLDGTCPHGICRTSYIMDQHAHAAGRDGMCWSQICWGEQRRLTQQMAEPERLSSKQVLQPTKPKRTIVIMRPSWMTRLSGLIPQRYHPQKNYNH